MNVKELIKELKTVANKDKEIVTYIMITENNKNVIVRNDLVCKTEDTDEVRLSFIQSKMR